MIIKGDVNGDGRITLQDVLLVQWHLLGGINLTEDAFIAADINNDGELSIVDMARISQHLSGSKIINEVID